MIIIGYDDFDLLKSAVDEEEKRLSSLYKNSKELSKLEAEIRETRKKSNRANNQADYDDQIRKLRDLESKKQAHLDKIHRQSIENILDESRYAVTENEKIYLERLDQEQYIKELKIKFLKEEDLLKKESLKEQIQLANEELDNLKRKEEYARKQKNIEDRRYSIIKKIQSLEEVGDKNSLKRLEVEKKRLEVESKREELNKRLEEGNISQDEYLNLVGALKESETGAALADWGENLKKELSDAIAKSIKSGLNKVDEAIEDITSHRIGIMARLQGIGGQEYNYANLLDTVSKNLAVSPYVTQKAFMKKLDEAVDKGIAYNVEQRAFLNTVKDSISTTFDAFDSNLLRLIRLQQADSTAARLGMEAALTRTLNSVFTDTSYLSDMYDNISAAIVESESLMTRNAATEFEYIVQKWMGALYSLGASNELVSQIAQGINYLGTGNVQALASNSPLQTLFAMSASRGGLDYADLLVKGLDSSNTNKLLKSMVEYLKEIAEDNRNNNVVKAAYGDLYNMSLADMRAITSLTEGDISSIYSQTMSYGDMQSSLSDQFKALSRRFSTGEMIKNVVDNFIYSTGSEIAQNAISYTLWQITDLVKDVTGGIHLPAVSVWGNMIDLSAFTVDDLLKAGIVGTTPLGQIGNIINSIGNKGGLNLNAWNYTDMLQRGEIQEQTVGSIESTSGSSYISSSSVSDMKKASIASATEESKDVAEITNADLETEYSFDDWYRAILIDNDPIYIKSSEEYSANDIYKSMYKDKTPIPVTLDQNSGLGTILMNLSSYITSLNRVTDVNIKKSDIQVPVAVYKLDNKLKEEIKAYVKNTYIDLLSAELKESLIGQSKGLSGVSIAKVCDRILNDKVDVEVRNNNFDRFLDIQSGIFG